MTGHVVQVGEQAIVLDVGNVGYEVLVPRSAVPHLQPLLGKEVTLFTIQYFDGNPAVGHLVPRLVGFLAEAERDFFSELTKVKGLGIRKALRTMSLPASQIALAIENGNERFLSSLPEVGKRTATQIVAQLRGKVQRFVAAAEIPAPAAELPTAQKLALDILVSWGDRRSDAERWVAAAVEAQPELSEPDEIVRAAYRAKSARPGQRSEHS